MTPQDRTTPTAAGHKSASTVRQPRWRDVTMSRPKGLSLILAVLTLVATACASDASPTTTSEAESTNTTDSTSTTAIPTEALNNVGTVTVKDTDCALDLSAGAIEPGTLVLSTRNESTVQAAVDVFQVTDLDALRAHVDEEVRRAEAGEPILGHPPSEVASLASSGSGLLEPGSATEVEINAAETGSYGVVCVRFHENTTDPLRPVALVGPIQVGDPAVTPSARGYHRLVATDGGIILLGGFRAPGPVNESTLTPDPAWVLTIDGWMRLELTDPPINDAVYDSLSKRLVVLAPNHSALAPQLTGPTTFTYDPASNAATQMGPGGPEGLIGVRAAYDVHSDRVIAFGGWDLGPTFGSQTWAYDVDTDTWQELDPAARPEGRNFHEMVYDPLGRRLVLFGGGDASRNFPTTWAYDYDSDSWTEIAAEGPPPRVNHAMAYDPERHRLILFGGVTLPREEPLDDTWEFDLETDTWTELTTVNGPSARGWHAMAFDVATRQIVLFGGGPSRTEYNAETWVFDVSNDTWKPGL